MYYEADGTNVQIIDDASQEGVDGNGNTPYCFGVRDIFAREQGF